MEDTHIVTLQVSINGSVETIEIPVAASPVEYYLMDMQQSLSTKAVQKYIRTKQFRPGDSIRVASVREIVEEAIK